MASSGSVQQLPREDDINLEALRLRGESNEQTGSTDEPEGFSALERWNSPPINTYRTFATLWSFLVMGANDAAYGVSAQ